MFECCLAELRYLARNDSLRRQDGALIAYNGYVVKSDSAVPVPVKLAIQNAVKLLENIPKPLKDWQPGSKKTIVNLVHPSLYPLVYGRTKVLEVGQPILGLEDCIKRCGEGKTIEIFKEPEANNKLGSEPYSMKHQWLPCEVDISGKNAK